MHRGHLDERGRGGGAAAATARQETYHISAKIWIECCQAVVSFSAYEVRKSTIDDKEPSVSVCFVAGCKISCPRSLHQFRTLLDCYFDRYFKNTDARQDTKKHSLRWNHVRCRRPVKREASTSTDAAVKKCILSNCCGVP